MPAPPHADLARRHALLVAVGALASTMAGSLASAADELAAASATVKRFADGAVAAIIATERHSSARATAFASLLRDAFDLERIAGLVLGRLWRDTDAAGRAAFLTALESATAATYARRFEAYRGERLVVGTAARSGRDVVVHTRLRPAFGPEIPIDWRLREGRSGWRIIDVVVEGMSMVVTHRAEFAALLARRGDGVDGLVAELNARTVRTVASSS